MKHPDLRHSYLIELKYLRRGEDTPERRAALIADGAAQLRRYLADVDLRRRAGPTRLHGLLLVYHGWELWSGGKWKKRVRRAGSGRETIGVIVGTPSATGEPGGPVAQPHDSSQRRRFAEIALVGGDQHGIRLA